MLNRIAQFKSMFTAKSGGTRFDLVDALRGFAVAQMLVFHFCFLLREFSLGFVDFYYSPFWLNFRTLIVIQFLLIVGVSLKIATDGGIKRRSYFGRLVQLFVYAGIVSLTTYLMEPGRVVIFGILQFILVASILGLIFVRWSWPNLLIGGGMVLLALNYSNPQFNQESLFWIGLMTRAPVTLDYVPLLPWFGVVVIGIYLGQLVISSAHFRVIRQWANKDPVSRLLALIGRHSLNIYMAHVPIFFVFIYFFLA